MRDSNAFRAFAATAALSLPACSSGQSAQAPAVTHVADLSTNRATLAVGVATFTDGSKGLNAVATFRSPDGASGALVDTPALAGPSTFVVPRAAAAIDAGTNHISASPQITSGTATATATTFGTAGGVFSYGFAPANADIGGAANFGLYALPFYGAPALTGTFSDADGNALPFEGGPPAYPDVRTGTYPAGFNGYTQGFTVFDAAPVSGSYTLAVVVVSANAGTTTVNAPAAILDAAKGLAAVPMPAFLEDGKGGGRATFVAPPGVTETVVDFLDRTAGTYYSVLAGGAGAGSAVLPDTVGIYAGGVAGPTLTAGDAYEMTVICADYPLFGAGPPQNAQQVPVLTGAAGQADIAFGPQFAGTYGGGTATAVSLRRTRVDR